MRETFSIGELSRQADVKVVTIRYYEQIGLLPRCERTPGNYRVYSHTHLERLSFVRRCRDLGFTLEQVRELLHLSTTTARTCADVCDLATEHLKDVEARIDDLQRLASELRQISESCNGKRSLLDCRIMAALSKPSVAR